ncbi:MAG: hypothetical protein ACI942_002267 [Planctomycetota bacterium]
MPQPVRVSYQIMGFNALKLSYPMVQDFVNEMYVNESNQLDAFERYIAKFGCITHLNHGDWAKFAKCYDGLEHAKNKYNIKLAMAYRKYLT